MRNELTFVSSRRLRTLGALLTEVVLFALGVLVALRIFDWFPETWQQRSWIFVALLTAVYLVLGATPLPWRRTSLLVALAAFSVPLWLLGWIDWRIQYFLLFEHSDAWENLPRVILGPENLAVASLVCAAAVLGQRFATTRIRGVPINAV